MESIKQFLGDLRNFGRREDGLVTVEWVALTAAMVVAAVVISYPGFFETLDQLTT